MSKTLRRWLTDITGGLFILFWLAKRSRRKPCNCQSQFKTMFETWAFITWCVTSMCQRFADFAGDRFEKTGTPAGRQWQFGLWARQVPCATCSYIRTTGMINTWMISNDRNIPQSRTTCDNVWDKLGRWGTYLYHVIQLFCLNWMRTIVTINSVAGEHKNNNRVAK